MNIVADAMKAVQDEREATTTIATEDSEAIQTNSSPQNGDGGGPVRSPERLQEIEQIMGNQSPAYDAATDPGMDTSDEAQYRRILARGTGPQVNLQHETNKIAKAERDARAVKEQVAKWNKDAAAARKKSIAPGSPTWNKRPSR